MNLILFITYFKRDNQVVGCLSVVEQTDNYDDMIIMKTMITSILVKIIMMTVVIMIISLFKVPSIQEWLLSQIHPGDLISADPRIISYTEWTNWDNFFCKLCIDVLFMESSQYFKN